ncbi:MAG TPA: hypothetical protein VFI23_11020 [Rhizomicrobium sp.]|nr:hypothetical protein [Rhizomicrobium sp.]
MRYLLVILLLLCPVCALAGNAGALLTQEVLESKCAAPDRTLIKQYSNGGTQWISERAPSKKYNEQVKGFNDCVRVYVEQANREIIRIRDDTKLQLDQMAGNATARIRRIERQIGAAIERVKAVNGLSSVEPAGPDAALDAFPEPECKSPDEKLLIPLRRARDNSARERQYDDQIQAYGTCMRGWIAEAKSEIVQIKTNTEAGMKPVTADANRQILQIWATILDVAKQADIAQREQDMLLADFRASTAIPVAPPSTPATGSPATTDAQLAHSDDMPTGAGDPDGISCRKPQRLSDSRFMGPEICKRNRVWADLYKNGKNISADGQKIVDSEKGSLLGPDAITR